MEPASRETDKLPALLMDERGRAPSLIRMKAKAYENKLDFSVTLKAASALQYFSPMNSKNAAFWDKMERVM